MSVVEPFVFRACAFYGFAHSAEDIHDIRSTRHFSLGLRIMLIVVCHFVLLVLFVFESVSLFLFLNLSAELSIDCADAFLAFVHGVLYRPSEVTKQAECAKPCGPVAVAFDAVDELLGILVAVFCGAFEILHTFVLIPWHVVAEKEKPSELIFSIGVACLRRYLKVSDGFFYIF